MARYSLLHIVPHALSFHVSRRTRVYIPVFVGISALLLVLILLCTPPTKFPVGERIELPSGVPFTETAIELERTHVVRSGFILRVLARVGGGDRQIQAGVYVFDRPLGVTSVLHRLVHGISGLPVAQVTFPEGTSVRQMADILEASGLETISQEFLRTGSAREGYLFPDTYQLPYEASAEDITALLTRTYENKLTDLRPRIEISGRSEHEVITMASLLEKEARAFEEKQTIAGILWKRHDQGRALQVDAVFGYINDVDTYHPSFEDLEVDSPYNTYLYPGLPPGPINNPGLESIEAALSPIETEYFYYLTGTDGIMRYAKTFEEHKQNRELYLE